MSTSLDLLRRLGSGVLPPGVEAAPKLPPATHTDQAAFPRLLEKARAGDIAGGAPVRVARSAGLDLTPSQLDRLALATDRAEAQGATNAAVLIDGMLLTVDVATRTVLGRVDLHTPGVLTGTDCFVVATPDPLAPTQGTSPTTTIPPPIIPPAAIATLGDAKHPAA